MRASEDAPCDPFRLLERRHGFAKIIKRGGGLNDNLRVIPPHLERVLMRISENAPRHGRRSAQQSLGFFETNRGDEVQRVADRFSNGFYMFLARELQASGVDFLPHAYGLLDLSKRSIRVRTIALHYENFAFWCAKAPQRRQLGLLHG